MATDLFDVPQEEAAETKKPVKAEKVEVKSHTEMSDFDSYPKRTVFIPAQGDKPTHVQISINGVIMSIREDTEVTIPEPFAALVDNYLRNSQKRLGNEFKQF